MSEENDHERNEHDGGSVPVNFDLSAHEFETAEHSFATNDGVEIDTYDSAWQRVQRSIL